MNTIKKLWREWRAGQEEKVYQAYVKVSEDFFVDVDAGRSRGTPHAKGGWPKSVSREEYKRISDQVDRQMKMRRKKS